MTRHPHVTSSKDSAVSALIATAETLAAWCHDAQNKGDGLNLDHLRDLRARVVPVIAAIGRLEQLTPARHRSPIDPPQPPPRDGKPSQGMDRMKARRAELGIVR